MITPETPVPPYHPATDRHQTVVGRCTEPDRDRYRETVSGRLYPRAAGYHSVPLLAGSRYWRTLNLALNEFRYRPGSGRHL